MYPYGRERLETGCLTISLDTELAWGTNAHGEFRRYTRHLENTRWVIGQLLQRFETYRVSATWALVGHLFLSECRREGRYPHPDVLTPTVPGMEHWHMHDPASTLEAAPLWYGRDLVSAIRRCLQPQEIGCHTFTHVRADWRSCTQEVFQSQVRKCLEVAGAEGLRLRSFVHPENGIAYVDTLAELGFVCYRGKASTWYAGLPRLVRRAGRLADCALAICPPTYPLPEAQAPLNLPGSMLLGVTDGCRRLIPNRLRIRRAIRGLDRAVARREIFHLWFHPWNLAGDPDLLRCLDEILAYADRLRGSGDLTVMTMGEIADLVLGAETGEIPRQAA